MIKCDVRMEWNDLDGLGHVSNLSIYGYVQIARIALLREAGMCKIAPTDRFGTVIVHIDADFKKQLYFPGTITVEAQVREVGRTSCKVHYRIIDEHGDVAVEMNDAMVHYDFAIPGKTVISAEKRAVLLSHME